MLFNTWQYLLFLPAAVVVFYLTPGRLRWAWLAVASSVFLLFGQLSFWVVCAAVTAGTWFCGRAMSRHVAWYWVGLAFNLLVLVFFKYHYLLPRAGLSLAELTGIRNPILQWPWILPLGISYYVFQAIGYLTEIKWGTHPAERHPGRFAAYLMFFPKLLQGPVERAHDFLPQLQHLPGEPEYANFRIGFRLILWGLFKKMCVADRLNPITEQAFYFVDDFHGWGAMLGLVLYPVQLYADFSGYTDIALGSARLFGLKLSQNFNRPFLAYSVTEFWRRWHISLSSWVRDYIYTPLSLLLTMRFRIGKLGIWLALVVAFVLLGVWHGATYTFLLFGLLQGIAMALELMLAPLQPRLHKLVSRNFARVLGMATTFAFFAVSCVFFRAGSLHHASTLLTNVLSHTAVHPAFTANHWSVYGFGITMALAVLFLVADHGLFTNGFSKWVGKHNLARRWLVYAFLLFCIFSLSGFEPEAFVYEQF